MLTALVGTDTALRQKRLGALLAPLEKKGADVLIYTDVSFDAAAIRELASSVSLFGGEIAIVLSGIAERADMRDELEKLIPDLAASTHYFVLSENSLPAPLLKKLTGKKAVIIETGDVLKAKKAEAFNSFALTDAYADRKRSHAWALYRKAIDTGIEPRELHGKLFWAVKSMIVAQSAKAAGESGLNPFVFQKSKHGAGNFAQGELATQAKELTLMFHEALASGLDLETSLEAFILRSLAK